MEGYHASFRASLIAVTAAIVSTTTIAGTLLAFSGGAQAQGGAKMLCPVGQQAISVTHGTVDAFSTAGTPDPLADAVSATRHPDPQFDIAKQHLRLDACGIYNFGDTLYFTLAPGETVTAAQVTTNTRSNGDISSNDTMSFLQAGGAAPTFTTFSYNGADFGGPRTYVFNGSGATPIPNASMTNPLNILAALTANKRLDVVMQDDSSVDFITLDLCVAPPPPYDIAVRKTHDGSHYGIAVTNPGRAISAPAKIEVTELVPAGLNVTSIGGTGWSCTPTPPPWAILDGDHLHLYGDCDDPERRRVAAHLARVERQAGVSELRAGKALSRGGVSARAHSASDGTRGNRRKPAGDTRSLTLPTGPVLPFPRPGSWVLVNEPNMENNVSCPR